ncbi:MAG TPA: hypothetical protein VGG77_04470 [Roseiarcus sp.]
MSPVIITLLVLLAVGLLLALWLMGVYNGLVVARKRFENAFAQIDVQLKRRYELAQLPKELHETTLAEVMRRHRLAENAAINAV